MCSSLKINQLKRNAPAGLGAGVFLFFRFEMGEGTNVFFFKN